jgi:hypothetical protein
MPNPDLFFLTREKWLRLHFSPERKIRSERSEPIVDPLCRVVEEVFPGIGIFRRRSGAIGAGADAGHRAFDDDEVFVRALSVQIIDLHFLDQVLKLGLTRHETKTQLVRR